MNKSIVIRAMCIASTVCAFSLYSAQGSKQTVLYEKLLTAINDGDLKRLHALEGALGKHPDLLNRPDDNGSVPLVHALGITKPTAQEIIEFLIDHDASPLKKNQAGETILTQAVTLKKKVDNIDFFLSNIDSQSLINKKNKNSKSPLDIALQEKDKRFDGNESLIDVLLKYNAKANILLGFPHDNVFDLLITVGALNGDRVGLDYRLEKARLLSVPASIRATGIIKSRMVYQTSKEIAENEEVLYELGDRESKKKVLQRYTGLPTDVTGEIIEFAAEEPHS